MCALLFTVIGHKVVSKILPLFKRSGQDSDLDLDAFQLSLPSHASFTWRHLGHGHGEL